MSFVQRDDMVQDLSATTSDPSFCRSVLPRRLDARPLRLQTRRLQKSDDGDIEFRIAVQDHVTVWARFRKGLAQLLHDPLRTRMSSDVAMFFMRFFLSERPVRSGLSLISPGQPLTL